MLRSLVVAVVALAALPASAQVRIKDITDVAGARSNKLVGFGLVTGLDGTGSRSTFTQQVAVEMMQRLGVTTQIFSASPSENILRSTSLSAVMVTADIGPWVKKGAEIDVTVSCMDDARSLQGGLLIATTLKGLDGQVYAIAQGSVSLGGFSVSGQAAGVQKNQLNVGRVVGGAQIEKEAPGEMVKNGKLQLLLRDADFNTARLIAKSINAKFADSAEASDAGRVCVILPLDSRKPLPELIAEIGLLEVKPDTTAKVIVNERTGTIVAGENVTLSPGIVSHGNLFLRVAESPVVSQPGALSGGTTAVVPRTSVGASEEKARVLTIPKAATVGDVARALNALGVTPRDLITIFQGMKQAGMLHAELKPL